MNYLQYEDYLQHHGVKGMKWGVRKVRGHAGPGRYITRKRQLAGDKRDLEYLNKGGHLSVGLTKKRQAAYDRRDRARLEQRIARNEEKLAQKEAAKQNITPEQKTARRNKAIKIGAAAAGTALAAYGAYKVNKVVKNKAYNTSINKGMDAVRTYMKTYEGTSAQRLKMQRNLTADVVQTAKNNSSNIRRSVNTLKGYRQFSNAELKNMGLKTIDLNRVDLNRVFID